MSTNAENTGTTGAPTIGDADYLITVFDAAALNVRRGRRLDAAVGKLDRLVRRLADAAAAPQGNAADPFTVETPHRPTTNSDP